MSTPDLDTRLDLRAKAYAQKLKRHRKGEHVASVIRAAIKETESATTLFQEFLDCGGHDSDGDTMATLDRARKELEWALGGIDETGVQS